MSGSDAAVPFLRLFHGIIVHESAYIAKIVQRVGFQRNNRVKDIRCNELYFKGLKTAKKGLM